MTLYNEYEALNEAGQSSADQIERALKPLIANVVVNEIPLREMEGVLHSTAGQMIAERVLLRASTTRTARRNHQPVYQCVTGDSEAAGSPDKCLVCRSEMVPVKVNQV